MAETLFQPKSTAGWTGNKKVRVLPPAELPDGEIGSWYPFFLFFFFFEKVGGGVY